jgi:hypothetical protein
MERAHAAAAESRRVASASVVNKGKPMVWWDTYFFPHLLRFLREAALQIVYHRRVYPGDMFQFSDPQRISHAMNDDINSYIHESIEAAKVYIEDDSLDEIAIILYSKNNRPLEKWAVRIRLQVKRMAADRGIEAAISASLHALVHALQSRPDMHSPATKFRIGLHRKAGPLDDMAHLLWLQGGMIAKEIPVRPAAEDSLIQISYGLQEFSFAEPQSSPSPQVPV